MESYKVKIYPAAKQDLLDIVDYLNTLSPDAALRYYDLLTEQIASLSHMPERCPHPRDLALAAKGYRCLLVEKYLVFYVVAGDFDFEKRTVSISKSYQRIKGQDVITAPKTAKSNRVIQMPAFLCEEMENYIRSLYAVEPTDRIFAVTESYLHREMDRGSKEAGVKRSGFTI